MAPSDPHRTPAQPAQRPSPSPSPSSSPKIRQHFSNNNQHFSNNNQHFSNNNQPFSNNNQPFSNNNQHFSNNQHFQNNNHLLLHHTPAPSLASLLNPAHPSASSAASSASPSASSSSSPSSPPSSTLPPPPPAQAIPAQPRLPSSFHHQPRHQSLQYPPPLPQHPQLNPSILSTPRLSEPSSDRPFKRTKLTPDHLHHHHPHLSRSDTPERASQSPKSISTTITLQSNEDRSQSLTRTTTLLANHPPSSLEHFPPPPLPLPLPPLLPPPPPLPSAALHHSHLPPILKQHRSFSTPLNLPHLPSSPSMIDHHHHYHHSNSIVPTDYHHHQQQHPNQIKNHNGFDQRSIDHPSPNHHQYSHPSRSPNHSDFIHQANHTNNHHHNPSSSSASSSRASTTTSSATALTVQSNLEESIFGIAPYDDFTWTIAQFIWKHARPYWERGEGHLVEVEAKLGTIRDKRNQGERMYYPIGTESPILDTRDTRFETDMTTLQHENLNRLLNQRVTETNSTGYSGSKVEYSHIKEVDEFFESKVRVTRNWGNNHHRSTNPSPDRSIIKEKLAHLDVHCPDRPFDFRVSVNIEHPVPLPHEHATATFKRIKDRLSYSHQVCQIDLTQVKSSEHSASPTHEVEVEFKDSNELLRAASIWSATQTNTNMNDGVDNGNKNWNEEDRETIRNEPGPNHHHGNAGDRVKHPDHVDGHHYLLMVEVLLNNVRMLIRNC